MISRIVLFLSFVLRFSCEGSQHERKKIIINPVLLKPLPVKRIYVKQQALLLFDALSSSLSLAKDPPRDLQIVVCSCITQSRCNLIKID